MTAKSIQTAATLTLEKTDAGFTITAVHLDVAAVKAGCPVSRVLNAKITMDARLEA